MHALSVLTGLPAHKTSISTMVAAAAMFLSGCAMERITDARRPASDCRMNAVLYCEADAHDAVSAESCRCVRGSDVRIMLRGLSRR